jgi:hypothetical protein
MVLVVDVLAVAPKARPCLVVLQEWVSLIGGLCKAERTCTNPSWRGYGASKKVARKKPALAARPLTPVDLAINRQDECFVCGAKPI